MKTPSIQVNVLESSQSWNVTALSHVNRNAFTSKPHFRSVHGGQDQKTLLSVRSFHLMTSDLSHVLSPLLKRIWKIHWKTPTTVFLLQEFLGKVMAEYSRSIHQSVHSVSGFFNNVMITNLSWGHVQGWRLGCWRWERVGHSRWSWRRLYWSSRQTWKHVKKGSKN